MYFRQILHLDLGCASYVIADRGEAAVVDPKWDIREYLDAAAEARAEIRHVLETHTHADHVSGRCRLIAATGATPHIPGLVLRRVREGHVVRVGEVELVALASPGHRPEHTAYLVREGGVSRRLLSGDSLLVGDVARPDLATAPDAGARALWETLQRFLALDDEVELWPGHVGGSLCASRSASSATSSTIGHERLRNPMLSFTNRADFTAEVTGHVPARPPSVERVVALNRRGAKDPGPVREVDAGALHYFLGQGVCVLDVRDPEEFDAAHLDGSINVPSAGRGRGTKAAWAAGDEAVLLIAPSIESGHRTAASLRAAGIWKLIGLSVADPLEWNAAGLRVRSAFAVVPERIAPRIRAGEVTLVDVRDASEWSARHIDSSRSLPLAQLGDGRSTKFASRQPLAVVCASGGRAAVAASILRRRGHDEVWRVSGGIEQFAPLGMTMEGDAS